MSRDYHDPPTIYDRHLEMIIDLQATLDKALEWYQCGDFPRMLMAIRDAYKQTEDALREIDGL